jgi:hypothetical protein
VEDSLGDKFVIFLRRCYAGSLNAMSVRNIFPRESMIVHALAGSNHAVDRVFRRLQSGKSVSAALRAGRQSGERVLILDIAGSRGISSVVRCRPNYRNAMNCFLTNVILTGVFKNDLIL